MKLEDIVVFYRRMPSPLSQGRELKHPVWGEMTNIVPSPLSQGRELKLDYNSRLKKQG